MSQRKIITEPDTILRKKSVTLEKVDNELRELMDDMLETMYAAPRHRFGRCTSWCTKTSDSN